MNHFNKLLLIWFEENKRNLPWRSTKDPYKIWISEIILQQTRVVQGLNYYHNIINKCPTVYDLANLSEDQLMKLWQGLGYYNRARKMQQTAKLIVEKNSGQFPTKAENILSLPGIGPYTAAAIGSIAFNLPLIAIDGNVARVASRFFGIYETLRSKKSDREIETKLMPFLPQTNRGDFNQAWIELGATICLPKNPKCNLCPISQFCFAKEKHEIISLPVVAQKKAPKEIHRVYFFITDNQNKKTVITQRDANGIWPSLYEFPNIEMNNNKVRQKTMFQELFLDLEFTIEEPKILHEIEIKHQLTHQTIFASFYHIVGKNIILVNKNKLHWRKTQTLQELPMHRLMEKYCELYCNLLPSSTKPKS